MENIAQRAQWNELAKWAGEWMNDAYESMVFLCYSIR